MFEEYKVGMSLTTFMYLLSDIVSKSKQYSFLSGMMEMALHQVSNLIEEARQGRKAIAELAELKTRLSKMHGTVWEKD